MSAHDDAHDAEARQGIARLATEHSDRLNILGDRLDEVERRIGPAPFSPYANAQRSDGWADEASRRIEALEAAQRQDRARLDRVEAALREMVGVLSAAREPGDCRALTSREGEMILAALDNYRGGP